MTGDDGEIAGYGWLDSEWGDAQITFWVDPARRGAGVGDFIVDHLEDEAAARGLNYIYNVVPGQPPGPGLDHRLADPPRLRPRHRRPAPPGPQHPPGVRLTAPGAHTSTWPGKGGRCRSAGSPRSWLNGHQLPLPPSEELVLSVAGGMIRICVYQSSLPGTRRWPSWPASTRPRWMRPA